MDAHSALRAPANLATPSRDGCAVEPPSTLAMLESLTESLPGWCTPRKALWLAGLVTRNEARRICEIGVYGGRSLLPMALALRKTPGACAYAVEPWRNDVAVRTPMNAVNDLWWLNVDLQEVKSKFLCAILAHDLTGIVKIVELASNEARLAFLEDQQMRFDLLHIDGSHAEAQALADVRDWLPLVKPGGIIVLDDINWETVASARNFLRRSCMILEEIDEGEAGSYGAYRVPSLLPGATRIPEFALG